jgi:hypothetical protein
MSREPRSRKPAFHQFRNLGFHILGIDEGVQLKTGAVDQQGGNVRNEQGIRGGLVGVRFGHAIGFSSFRQPFGCRTGPDGLRVCAGSSKGQRRASISTRLRLELRFENFLLADRIAVLALAEADDKETN